LADESFYFLADLTYFCHCDTHWNNGLRPPSTLRHIPRSFACGQLQRCGF